jgi:hypothetical protein
MFLTVCWRASRFVNVGTFGGPLQSHSPMNTSTPPLLAANRATALALASRENARPGYDNLYRVGVRGAQWAVGPASVLSREGYLVLA